MAAAVWRNLLGGRGTRGISPPGASVTPSTSDSDDASKSFRRSVNLVGGLVENVDKIDVNVEETTDDSSGVYDFGANENDQYITYPEPMETLVAYLRREAQRLERFPDESILGPRGDG
ncbi:hypothetical protein JVU11DRAFT_3840 [Chiua virens]|nr:hypothetical protein JVU11DRAFT_3840 [Chiua virens]